jgi:DNA repair exonuclease SbcCD ATPase subunit
MESLFVVSMELFNWLRYRGKHEIALLPTVYGVTATLAEDAERSNWLGKSAFLATMRFVLFGKRPVNARTADGQYTEDGWITWGEKNAHVAFVLNDGTRIKRSRVLGKSTQLEVVTSQGATLAGDAAQEYVRELVGLDLKDLDASCFVAQKKMAHFVTCKASERYTTIFGWMRLEKVQAAAGRVGDALVKMQRERDDLDMKVATAKASIASILARYFDDVEGANLEDAARELVTLREELDGKRASSKVTVDSFKKAARERDAWLAMVTSAKKGKALADEADALEGKLDASKGQELEAKISAARAKSDAAIADKSTASKDRTTKATLATGLFNGVCPVDGHACPDQGAMNTARERNVTLLSGAQGVERAAILACTTAARELEALEGERDGIMRVCAKIAALREQAEEHEADVAEFAVRGAPPEVDPNVEGEAKAVEVLQNDEVEVREIDRLSADFTSLRSQLASRELAIAELDRKIRLQRQAFMILGRNGVQRRFAERARVAIEAGANALLEANATDLRVHLAWEREAGGLAVQCDECGSAFPTSQKVKVCERCGAGRGPKTVDELRCELTNRSGAAEDLAGGAVQLAAAAWLRGERRARWSVAFIDEPFGALDTHNRKAFAAHLTSMLRSRYGFAQAFVVAHEAGIMDALPGRIAIAATEDRSSVAVV